MKPNILFVNFPTIPFDRLHDHFEGKSVWSVQLHGEPLGILHLSSYLKSHSLVNQIGILDFSIALLRALNYDNVDHFIEEVTKEDVPFVPDIVACSINFTTSHPFMLRSVEYLKTTWPDATVVVGGNHATNATTKLLSFPFFDYVARGEAEVGFAQFVKEFAEGKTPDVKGIYSDRTLPPKERGATIPRWIIGDGSWSADRSDHLLDRCDTVDDLDDLPSPDWDLIDMETYATEQGRAAYIGVAADKRKASLFTSRGCPFRCTFCATHTTFTRLLRYHSPAYISAQIKHLHKKYGITLFIIEDDLFTGNKEKVIEMLQAFKELNIPQFELQFPNALSVNTLNEAVIDALVDAKMETTELAVESGSDHVQKNVIHKRVRLHKVKPWIDYLHKKNVLVKALFILGFPNETKEQMLETIEFAKSIKADWSIFNAATPLVGTEMYEEFVNKGVITDDLEFLALTDFRKRVFDTEEVSAEELNDLVYRANLDVNFVNNPNLVEGRYERALELYDDVIGKYPWHIVALACSKRCQEGLGEDGKARALMSRIEEAVRGNNRAQAMLESYASLMPELEKLVAGGPSGGRRDGQLEEALALGTKTN